MYVFEFDSKRRSELLRIKSESISLDKKINGLNFNDFIVITHVHIYYNNLN